MRYLISDCYMDTYRPIGSNRFFNKSNSRQQRRRQRLTNTRRHRAAGRPSHLIINSRQNVYVGRPACTPAILVQLCMVIDLMTGRQHRSVATACFSSRCRRPAVAFRLHVRLYSTVCSRTTGPLLCL